MTSPEQRPGPAARPVFIDALNVAYWCGSPPSLRVPLTLLIHLLRDGHEVLLYFDASARYRLGHEAQHYGRLLQFSGLVVEVPSGCPADRLMLRQATARGACILSRDKYRDHRRRYRRLIDDPQRLIPGAVQDDRVLLPALGLDLPLVPSLDEAWEELESGRAYTRDR